MSAGTELIAQGGLALALAGLEQLFADCTALQERAGGKSAEQLKREHIFFDEFEDIGEIQATPTPFVILVEEQYDHVAVGEGPHAAFRLPVGGIRAAIVDKARHRETHKRSKLDYLNFVSVLCDQLDALKGNQGQYLSYNARQLLDPTTRSPIEDRQKDLDLWSSLHLFTFGEAEAA